MTSIYENDKRVGELSRIAVEATGSSLLQIHRFSEQDDLHASILLDIFRPAAHAKIIDVGCGVGELAELMSKQRPDLQFTLTNISAAQLAMCPTGFKTVKCSAEHLPFNDREFDVVLCAYVLGHVDIRIALAEFYGVLNSSGKVCVYDIFKTQELCRTGSDLAYNMRTMEEMIELFESECFKFSHSQTTKFALPRVDVLMPHADTLKNTISAAMVFTK